MIGVLFLSLNLSGCTMFGKKEQPTDTIVPAALLQPACLVPTSPPSKPSEATAMVGYLYRCVKAEQKDKREIKEVLDANVQVEKSQR